MVPSTFKPSSLNTFFPSARIQIVSFRKKQVVFSQGDPSDSIFFIERGTVKLTVVSRHGREAIFAVLGGGSFFGENCIASDKPTRFHNAIAITDLRVATIDRNTFRAGLRLGTGNGTYAYIKYLLQLNENIQQQLIHNLLESSEQRLARALLSLASVIGENKGNHVLPMSQQNLGDMIGATRQRVNSLLKRFRKSGFIDNANGLRVCAALRKVAGKG